MGNNNVNANKKDEEKDNKKVVEDKIEIKDEVKDDHVPVSEVVKPPVAARPASGSNINNKKDDPKKAIDEEIAKLEEDIKKWEAIIHKSKNSIIKAIYADRILQSNIRIAELKGTIDQSEKKIDSCEVATVSDSKPDPEPWRFFM